MSIICVHAVEFHNILKAEAGILRTLALHLSDTYRVLFLTIKGARVRCSPRTYGAHHKT